MTVAINDLRTTEMVRLLTAIIAAVLGALGAHELLSYVGEEAFQAGARFSGIAFGLIVAAVWVLKTDLQTIDKLEGLTVREKRECDHISRRGLRIVLFRLVFLILSGVYVTSSSWWQTGSEIFYGLTLVAGALVGLSILFLLRTVFNFYETHGFIRRVERRKTEDRQIENNRKVFERPNS